TLGPVNSQGTPPEPHSPDPPTEGGRIEALAALEHGAATQRGATGDDPPIPTRGDEDRGQPLIPAAIVSKRANRRRRAARHAAIRASEIAGRSATNAT